VAGYDPASPKKYHRLWTEHAARQGALTGACYEIGELEALDEISSGWRILAEHPGGERVEIDYLFLHWFDLVRAVWPKDGPGLYLRTLRSFLDYHRLGIMARARAEAPVIEVASSMPALVGSAYLLLLALLTAVLCGAGGVIAHRLGAPWFVGALPPLLIWLGAVPLWGVVDRRLPVGWLARGMIGVTDAGRGEIPAFAERARLFAGKIAEAAREPGWDEVLVVAHSMGGQQACRALGRALIEDPDLGRDRPVALLTLGSLLPFYSLSASADADYRREMAALAAAAHIPWVDVTGPGDAGCAAAIHPLAGLDHHAPADRPLRFSPRFHAVLEDERYRALKRQPLEMHFQYIRSNDRAGGYDFFQLTAGPEPLAQAARHLGLPDQEPLPA
jgi:hypothetical protein